MKIGELARRTDCTVETIRYYEREGLLPEPQRSEGNYRQYGERHVEQLVFIRNCRLLDMTHVEIRELLQLRRQPNASCGNVNGLIDAHIGHVSERIAALSLLQQQLVELRQQCREGNDVDHCGIIAQLETSGSVSPPEADSHVGRSHRH
ncbi:Cd(II)/Pb(II)-responsive transcriptional regulator [Halopseudomonas oceani]|uniref:Cd(II)/Pb(II)-responsive transcriptional regulator n=1 Tax=Halopseudomonas oceani TaxID=1708783 RepID=A0A2P4EST0_9GAMM|nr:Cd(II)/Pb(II)-responsive transcriptional regulator [Halopseudomonas oceani]POB02191.1 Cd(II)/Pb(II)-responsive transcriptional regulator [Halopseudomonas oceani]GGE53169.1 Cd(II)/Pb(II)-responsive transcriptional regulator [Halopseudomonas oceani]